jgi:hypothetical protein
VSGTETITYARTLRHWATCPILKGNNIMTKNTNTKNKIFTPAFEAYLAFTENSDAWKGVNFESHIARSASLGDYWEVEFPDIELSGTRTAGVGDCLLMKNQSEINNLTEHHDCRIK